jgi:hypothetical protein
MNTIDLEILKNKIEKMNKNHHIEILKILKNTAMSKLNENKSGVFVNLSFLPPDSLEGVIKYVNYIQDQENTLTTLETQKEDFKNTFFHEKDNKDETILYSSIK